MEKFDCAYDKIVETHKVTPNPKNNNRHSVEQIERLAKIIDYQGQRSPIVVSNLSGFIVKGHARLQAMEKLGWEKVAVDYQDYDNAAQEYADLTADNEIARWAELDWQELYSNLEELPDLDVDMLGIDDFKIPEVEIEPQCDEDETPEPPAEPVTKRGDVWLLGNHRVCCGDSTMIDDVEKLMAGEKADMVFTDPPFPNNSGIMHEMIENIDVAFSNSRLFCNGMSIWFWDNIGFPPFDEQVTSKHVWHKTNGWQAGHFETMYVFHNDNKRHEQLVFSVNSVGGGNKRETQGNHPTPKPIELPVMIFDKLNFKNCILDLFLGSGSTLIACEKTNRKCYGMELDEKYCDVIVGRWQKYTGKEAKLESNGETFNSMVSQNV